jgi:zinc transport system permease protein
MIALTIVLSVKVVGLLLVAAWIVIPAATARIASDSFARMTLLSICVSVASTVVGLAASFAADVPTGAAIVLVQALLFALFAILLRRN